MATTHDVIVVGGGVAGSSIAYHLALEGLDVCLVERQAIGAEASGASAGGVRQQHRNDHELPLALASIRRWQGLEDELAADLAYQRRGGIRFALSAGDVENLQASVVHQRSLGLNDLRWLSPAECRELIPTLRARVYGATYCPSDGHADPVATTRAFARAAHRYGATISVGTSVARISADSDATHSVVLESGDSLRAPHVVIAAGAWGANLARQIGVDLPIHTRVPQMLGTTPAGQHVLNPVVSVADRDIDRTLSLKQLDDGSFMIGGGWPSRHNPDTNAHEVDWTELRAAMRLASSVVPEIRDVAVERVWFGHEAQSADALPTLGPVESIEGIHLALGFSGHGFAIAPAVGEAIADVVCGRPSRHPIHPFHHSRFKRPAFTPVHDSSAG